ncbi:MAG: DNA topoisomerase 3 [Clostridia bacterium]|nr:DNA topoisomerase 3 [Clostridia bacterium]
MKTLVVAEKPSVGRDIARVLGGVKATGNGFLASDTHVVTWAVGHLVGLCEPDEVDEKYKKWRMDLLPMLPENIPLKVFKQTQTQFNVVKKLMNDKEISEIICATDSGREGELIFRYIYSCAGCNKPVKRLWVSSMTDAAIKAGLDSMKPSEAYDSLYLSAKCRSEADWLVGMNASRAFSLKYDAHLSVGRVQTPTLAILVRRDQEIDAFVPEEYYEVSADFGDYKGTWIDANQKTHISTKEKADEIRKKIAGKTGKVVESARDEKRKPPEKLYDLTTLQREANRKFGFSADKTLKLAQSLYETRKMITYPRTDSSYLPDDMIPKVQKTLNLLPEPYQAFVKAIAPVKTAKRIYDNSKVTDHHAIIPTDRRGEINALSEDERKIFDLIARKLIAAHYPDYIYSSTKIITDVEGEKFKTQGNMPISEGWRALYRGEEKKKEDEGEIPLLAPGDERAVKKAGVKQQKTKPPSPHTDDTLLKAMEDAGKTIEDEFLREKMKDSGLGTPATRAATITRLIDVGYAQRKGKQIFSTEKGRLLVKAAPEEMTSALTTGKWERALSKMAHISDKDEMERKEKRFMESIQRFCIYLVDYAKTKAPYQRFPDEKKSFAPKKAQVKKTQTEAKTKHDGTDAQANPRNGVPDESVFF